MNKRLIAVLAVVLIILSAFILSHSANGAEVFSENFSSGNFASWSRTFMSVSSSQTVSGGVAQFIVPTPESGTQSFSYLVKDGFTSTSNSTIIACEDVYVAKVPFGCVQGNGAIYFFYVCDSTDLTGNNGNFGVGIDGSGVWTLWIGGNAVYTSLFQTTGSPPTSNTWYRIVLTINNQAATVTLTVNDAALITAGQQQFTGRTHPISLMAGMGEDWWSAGQGQQEVDIDNIALDISDSDAVPNPTAEPTPTTPSSSQGMVTMPYPTPTPPPTKPSPSPEPSPSSPPSNAAVTMQATSQDDASITLTLHGNLTSAQMSTITLTRDKTANQTALSFAVTGQGGTAGFCNLTVPKSSVVYGALPRVYVDRQLTPNQGWTQDDDNYYVWFTLHFSKHILSIVFTPADSPIQIQFWLALPIVITAAICATAAFMLKKTSNPKANRQPTQAAASMRKDKLLFLRRLKHSKTKG